MLACIIGAGGAGLCAARHLSSLTEWTPVIFEASSGVGGVWVYDENAHHCNSMYQNLRTNLPKEVMNFPDFPFPPCLPSFIGHKDMRKYLEAYVEHFGLLDYVKLNHEVISVGRSLESSKTHWLIRVKNLLTNEILIEAFDAIFICNGHYSKPYIPNLPGANEFRGLQLHSTNYRSPEKFSGMRVACVGAGPSGIDIALDLSSHVEKVYFCHRKPRFVCPLPSNLVQLPVIIRLSATGIVIADDDGEKEIDIDALIYCTGYEYSFPFLDASCELNSDGRRVTPLYQHIININQPSLYFIGLCSKIFPFPVCDTQMKFVISILTGNLTLPSKEEMLQWEREDFERRQSQNMNAHELFGKQPAYMGTLAEMGCFESRARPVDDEIFKHLITYIKSDLLGYHSLEYEIVSDHEFVVTMGAEGNRVL